MKFEILTYGQPILRVKATPVERVTPELRQMAAAMLETMYGAAGIGLAAQQVGRAIALCVIDVPPELDAQEEGGPRLNPDVRMPLIMFNPQITKRSKAGIRIDEGCLSFPGIHVAVERAAEVTVAFTDVNGAPQTVETRGLLARAVQHEMDHLSGVLLVDRMSPIKKISLAGELRRLKARATAQVERRSA